MDRDEILAHFPNKAENKIYFNSKSTVGAHKSIICILFCFPSSSALGYSQNISKSRLWSWICAIKLSTRYNHFHRVCTIRKIRRRSKRWLMSGDNSKHSERRKCHQLWNWNWNQNYREVHVAFSFAGKGIIISNVYDFPRMFYLLCIKSEREI